MKANVGGVDRTIRILAGLALIAWALFGNGPVWAWVGLPILLTGIFSFCFAYTLLGMSTCKPK